MTRTAGSAEGQAARLSAGTSVTASGAEDRTEIALTRYAHTKRTVNKAFQLYGRILTEFFYFFL